MNIPREIHKSAGSYNREDQWDYREESKPAKKKNASTFLSQLMKIKVMEECVRV